MDSQQYFKNLITPKGAIDVVLDTDAYNEVDDQYAIGYMLQYPQRLHVKGICAAPFYNKRSTSAEDGMEKSYEEIVKLLRLMHKDDLKDIVFKGSRTYLRDEETAVESEAAEFMAKLAAGYSPEKPLYIVAIGAITNVASAMLKDPEMKENCVVVWLGGHGLHMPDAASEFNMKQDIAAARVVFKSGVPLVLLPCAGVTDRFTTSKYELEHWLKGKNALCDYLCDYTVRVADAHGADRPWSRIIWDVTAVAWLLNENHRFMKDKLVVCPLPEYDRQYALEAGGRFIKYVYYIHRDELFQDLFRILTKEE